MTLGQTPPITTSYISDEFKHELPRSDPKLAKNIFDNFSLKGKTAIITGAARGIGYAIAECYSQAGADIAILDYQVELAKESAKLLSANYNNKVEAYFIDVSNEEEVDRVVRQVEADFGTVDIFVANAGIAWTHGSLLSTENAGDKWRRMIDVDLNAVFYGAKAVGRIFKEQQKGSFIITASMSGHIANVPNYQTAYNVAKAGALHFGRSLAVEWSGFARVNTISPGYVDSGLSNFLDHEIRAKWWSLIPLGREALPQELVGAYLYLASDASTYTTGSDIKIDGGYTAV